MKTYVVWSWVLSVITVLLTLAAIYFLRNTDTRGADPGGIAQIVIVPATAAAVAWINALIASGLAWRYGLFHFAGTVAVFYSLLPVILGAIWTVNSVRKVYTYVAPPLYVAVLQNDMARIKLALARGDEINDPNISGKYRETRKDFGSVLGAAAAWADVEVVKFLVARGAKIDNYSVVYAGRTGNNEILEYLLQHGGDHNARDDHGNTGLIDVRDKSPNTVNTLLAAGADINAQNKNGDTALLTAVKNEHTDIVKALLAHHPRLDLVNSRHETVLHLASSDNPDLLAVLLAQRPPIDAPDKDGNTALHLLIEKSSRNAPRHYESDPVVVKQYADIQQKQLVALTHLLKAGANTNARNNEGQTPLMFALKSKQPVAFAELLWKYKANIDIADKAGRTALMHLSDDVVFEGDEVFSWLFAKKVNLNRQDNDGNTALLINAVTYRDEPTELLLKAGADPNIRNEMGHTALTRAVIDARGFQDKIPTLLEYGASVSILDLEGNSPLLLAIQNRSYFAENICVAGDKQLVNRPNKNGVTPLMAALLLDHSDSNVKMLLDAGADVSASDKSGNTVLHHLANNENSEIALSFLDNLLQVAKKKIDLDKRNADGMSAFLVAAARHHTPAVLKRLISLKVNTQMIDNKGNNALHLALTRSCSKTVEFLIKSGVSLRQKNVQGKTPLLIAAENAADGNTCSQDELRLLVTNGADINDTDSNGNTVLTLVLSKKSGYGVDPALMTFLLRGHTLINKKNAEGTTALMMACRNAKNFASVALLIDHGADVNAADNAGKTPAAWLDRSAPDHGKILSLLNSAKTKSGPIR